MVTSHYRFIEKYTPELENIILVDNGQLVHTEAIIKQFI